MVSLHYWDLITVSALGKGKRPGVLETQGIPLDCQGKEAPPLRSTRGQAVGEKFDRVFQPLAFFPEIGPEVAFFF